MSHVLVRRPMELWAFKLWPIFVVFLWCSILLTRGVLGYAGWPFLLTASLALVSSLVHFLFPYNIEVRYAALILNLVAMVSRSLDYALSGHGWKVGLAGFSVWITIAAAKVVIFILSAALVEVSLARTEVR